MDNTTVLQNNFCVLNHYMLQTLKGHYQIRHNSMKNTVVKTFINMKQAYPLLTPFITVT